MRHDTDCRAVPKNQLSEQRIFRSLLPRNHMSRTSRVCIPSNCLLWTFLYRDSVCYFATSNGKVFCMVYRNFQITRCRTYICDGILYANVEGMAVPVKELIAAIFLKDYDNSAPILMKDGNERNCNVKNLYQPLRRKGR